MTAMSRGASGPRTAHRRRLLLVGSGRHGRPYLTAAARRGARVALLDNPTTLASERTRTLLQDDDDTYAVTTDDPADWVAAAYRALADGPVDGVVAFAEMHVVAAALVAEELGLPSPGLRAAVVSRDKALQRALFARHGIAQPAYELADDADHALRHASGRYPVVVKPRDGSGSAGVRLLSNEDDLRAWSSRPDRPATFLVEEYLDGPELSVECVVQHSHLVLVAPTRKTTTPPPHFVEIGHRVPAGVTSDEQARLERTSDAVARALGVRDGLLHLEVRLCDGVPYVLEVAVRTPGDHILELHALAHGLDVFDAVVALALGYQVDLRRTHDGAAATWFATPAPGQVERVTGVDEVRALAGVVDLRVDVAPGRSTAAPASSADRAASAVLRAPDVAGLDELQRRVAETLVISTAP